MPFTKFTNLDFDQIKTSIKDYLRANSNFTDFDFEGSNFSALIDTLAYNTYITAFNSNMIVNESFLDSATIRQNVVSLAGNIGYVPRSKTAAKATVSLKVVLTEDVSDLSIGTATLNAGIISTGNTTDTTYIFSLTEDVKGEIKTEAGVGRVAYFDNLTIKQGNFIRKKFVYDGSLDQRFLLNNSSIDTNTISVYISDTETQKGLKYSPVENILNVNSESRIYFIREIQDERYEIRFGDGIFGKKLGDEASADGKYITVEYLTTDGTEGNGVSQFVFAGSLKNDTGGLITPNAVTFPLGEKVDGVYKSVEKSINGNDIEAIDSVRYYAPLTYSAQNRAVTPRDYEAIIKRIYPDAESISVVGGEELEPPEFGNVIISIKPKGGSYVSDFNKKEILSKLRQYSVSGINQRIIDLKILYVEVDSNVYYNESFTSTVSSLKSEVLDQLTSYSKSTNLNKFGGRFKYSKVQNVIDEVDRNAITSNITNVRIRRDLKASVNRLAQYELCFGNQFHVNTKGYNIKSTGFTIEGEDSTVYFTDVPAEDGKTGVLTIFKVPETGKPIIVKSPAGVVDYEKGEVIIYTLNITSTVKPDSIIEIQAIPESNDVVGLKDLYLSFDISKSTINMLRDLISSGDEISGVKFIQDSFASSYSNGSIIRD